MDGLPEITEVQRLTLKPGDVLVVHTNAYQINKDDADHLKARMREALGVDCPILLLARDMRVETLNGADVD